MNDTERRFPRSLAEAFPDQRAYSIDINGKQYSMHTQRRKDSFLQIYRLYRRAGHSVWYCARMAWNVAIKGWSF